MLTETEQMLAKQQYEDAVGITAQRKKDAVLGTRVNIAICIALVIIVILIIYSLT